MARDSINKIYSVKKSSLFDNTLKLDSPKKKFDFSKCIDPYSS